MDTLRRSLRGLLLPVFIPSVLIIVGLTVFALIFNAQAEDAMGALNTYITEGVGWWYLLVATVFVVFALYCAFSRIGRIKLGRDDEKPEFGLFSWFAMLFSAGMGIGLVFYSVAEPVSHYVTPPLNGRAEALTDEGANQALELTMFHWGIHAWAIYVVIGLGLAYMTYRKGRPLSVRWLLEPLFGRKRIEGPIGHAIDTVAIVGTLFGVATSLGFGVTQISAGLEFLGWLEVGALETVILIAIITGIAALSVVSGLGKGLKWLSNTNMVLAALLAIFVMALGPTLFILTAWVQNLGGYAATLPSMMLRTGPFTEDSWLGGWTIFYWGWWVSWAPFVGMFVARISRGRTIREFIGGVILAPTLVSSLWFSIFGDTGIAQARDQITAAAGAPITEGLVTGSEAEGFAVDTNTALFQLLSTYPLATVTSVLAIMVIVFFFVTSSDSGSLVVDILSTGGNLETPWPTRLFWAVLEGALAAALLLVGGTASLTALQTASIATAVPFSIVMVLAVFALLKAFHHDVATSPQYIRVDPVGAAPEEPAATATGDVAERQQPRISTTFTGLRPSQEGITQPGAARVLVATRAVPSGAVALDPETGAVGYDETRAPADPFRGEVFDTPEFASSAEGARLRENGTNGHTGNGHTSNGHTSNGHTSNGHTGNGHPGNGHAGGGARGKGDDHPGSA